MELNLAPQVADATVFEGDGGAYYSWTPAKSPVLAETNLGAGKLVLQPRGFALPHYGDSPKIGYVIQGRCTVGFISPNSPQEKILIIKKGDAIPVPVGTISWWFNGGDQSDVVIIFMGETTKSYNPGQFDYFFLSGAAGNLGGFSSEFISKIYNMTEDETQKLVKSQTGVVIVKLDDQIKIPDQSNTETGEIASLLLDAEITADNFPLLEKVGLSACLVRLEPNSVLSPSYTTNGSYRIIYVIKGSGEIQIVGLNGVQILDAKVQEDQIFVVPRFFAIAQIADGEGMEFMSVNTSARPEFGDLGGKLSPWKALSSSVVEAALNVDPQFVKFFKSKIEDAEEKKKKSS